MQPEHDAAEVFIFNSEVLEKIKLPDSDTHILPPIDKGRGGKKKKMLWTLQCI